MPDVVLTPVAIAMGSNLGDRRGHLRWAADRLAGHLQDLRLSSIIETEPFDVPDEQPPYLNAAAVGNTSLSAPALLELLMALERAQGRHRPGFRAARTLDLDIILYGDHVIETPDLIVPHPRFRERPFVLKPLAEIAAEWVDPVTGKTIGEMAGS